MSDVKILASGFGFPEGPVVANGSPVLENRLTVLGGSKIAIAGFEMAFLGDLWVARARGRREHDENYRQGRQLSERHGE